jgi:hypothetical protein
MEENDSISENLFFRHKDVFLNMTVFLPVKAICALRTVCKSFNSLLADPSEFTWKNRIQSAFPNSYETVLKENTKDQMKRLSVFDSLVDAGHSVSCLFVYNFTHDTPESQRSHFMNLRLREQVPWQRDLFIIVQGRVTLFDTKAASVLADLPIIPNKVLFNIKEKKIGFLLQLQGLQMLKLYRVESGTLIHENDVPLPHFYYSIMPQMYGDYLIWKTPLVEGTGVEFVFHSISKNKIVKRILFNATKDSFQQSSQYRPVIYHCHQDAQHKYHIHEIDSENQTSTLLYSDNINPKVRFERFGFRPIELQENEQGGYLRITQLGAIGLSVEIFDVQKRRMIVTVNFFNEKKIMKSYITETWAIMKYNPGTEHYCNTSTLGGIIVRNINTPLLDPNGELNSEGYPAELPPFFSKKFKGWSVSEVQWLNSDILICSLSNASTKNSAPFKQRWVLLSVFKQKGAIGHLDAAITHIMIFSDGNNVVAFNDQNEVYVIKLNTSFVT